MNEPCCIGFATKTTIDRLKQSLLDDLKREYTEAVNELWHGVFMKECVCTDIDIIKRRDYSFKFDEGSNDIFELGIETIFNKNKYLEELLCVTVEMRALDDLSSIIRPLVKYATECYVFRINKNSDATRYVSAFDYSAAPGLFIIVNSDDRDHVVIKMLTDNRNRKHLGEKSNMLLNPCLFEAFIEGLLIRNVCVTKYVNIDLGDIITTNFLETKSIDNVSFNIDSKYVIEHKDFFLKFNKSLNQKKAKRRW